MSQRKPPQPPDAEWLASLADNPAYKGIDIGRELAKLDNWLALPRNRKLVKTRARIQAWLDRVDVAVEGAVDQPRMLNKAVAERALERSSDQARTSFVKALATMASVFRTEVDDVLIEAYWVALRSWPPAALEGGARRLIASNIHFPRPAEWADAAKAWLLDKKARQQAGQLKISHSNAPPLKAEEVRQMVKDLAAKLSL